MNSFSLTWKSSICWLLSDELRAAPLSRVIIEAFDGGKKDCNRGPPRRWPAYVWYISYTNAQSSIHQIFTISSTNRHRPYVCSGTCTPAISPHAADTIKLFWKHHTMVCPIMCSEIVWSGGLIGVCWPTKSLQLNPHISVNPHALVCIKCAANLIFRSSSLHWLRDKRIFVILCLQNLIILVILLLGLLLHLFFILQ